MLQYQIDLLRESLSTFCISPQEAGAIFNATISPVFFSKFCNVLSEA
jgi:hypothetical protein